MVTQVGTGKGCVCKRSATSPSKVAEVPASMGSATRGVGDNVPHFWDQRGTGDTGGGPMKMIFASTADSLYSVLYK